MFTTFTIIWFDELTSYLGSIDPSAKLKWDVEYDVDIEDAMYSILNTVDETIMLIGKLRKLLNPKLSEHSRW